MSRVYYRLVSDYGWSDKSWLERFMSADEAITALNDKTGQQFTTIDEALNYDHPIYTIEVDHEGDTEDWDWMDS